MKRCPKCGVSKPFGEFNKNRAKQDGLQVICRPCSKIQNRHYYLLGSGKESRKRSRDRNRRKCQEIVMDLVKRSSCADCGTTDHRVFEFDHRDAAQKSGNISNLVAGGQRLKLLEEIKKCDIVCASCHRIRTFETYGSYRLGFES